MKKRRAPKCAKTSASRQRVWLAVTVIAVAAGGRQTIASESPESTERRLEEIQVTASRRPQRASEVSAAVTLIDAEAVRSVKLVTDALAAQPGVFLQQTTPGQGAAIVRGLKGSEVLHLVDGFRLNNAIFRNAPTQYLALISPASVERIEVLRGSPASLYGSEAVGGIVHVVNRQPSFDGPETEYRGELGIAADVAEQERALRAALDVGTQRAAALLSLDRLETGNRRIGGGERMGPSGYRSESARAALGYSPDDRTRWSLDLQYGRQPKTPRIDELVPGFGETEPASEEFFFAPNERRFAHLRYAREDGWLDASWTVAVGWQKIVDDRLSRDFASPERRFEDNASDLFGVVVSASGAVRGGSWVAGAEWYDDEVSSRRVAVDLQTGDREVVRARFPDGSDVRQAAVFAQVALPLTDRHTVTGGARLSAIGVDLAATPFAPGAAADFNDLSFDLGWTYQLSTPLQLNANLGYGFRAPNVFDLGALGERPGNRFNIPNPDLESERITQLDVGLRASSERLSADFVLWVLDYEDRITSVLTGDQTAAGRDVVQTQNAASATLWGVEARASYTISDGLSADFVLNATRGEQKDADGISTPADRVPPLNGRLELNYDLGRGLSVHPHVAFAAKQDRLSDRDVRDPRIDPNGTDAWFTTNVEARWRPSDRWLVSIAGHNLLDERYRTHGSGLDAPGRNVRMLVRRYW